ncbi:MAG: alpha/beta hydrolase [Caulobacteraceae bacterium]
MTRILALALAAVLLGPWAARASPTPVALVPCAIRWASEIVKCARVSVPEDWRRPAGRRLPLKVIVMPMTGPGPEQAPMIWLDGGPGIAGTNSAALYAGELKFHRARRAVILFDQRGTGASAPLHCPALERRSALESMYPPDLVAGCRRALEPRADLAQYTTLAAARDLDAIRAALGYSKVDLAGLSYGTMLAQAYMKLYPARVRAAALIGTVPLGEKLPLHHAANGEAALRLLFADCRAEPSCARAWPRLAGDWTLAMTRLALFPAAVTTPDGRSVMLRAGPFGEAVRSMLSAEPSRQRAPMVIARAAQGDFTPLLEVEGAGGPQLIAGGLYLSVACPEGTRRISSAEEARAVAGTSFGRYRVDQQIQACREWAPGRADPDLLTPLKSDIPVLLLAGGRDAAAPVAWARRVAAGLPRGRVVVIPAMTHLPIGLSNMVCLDRMMDAFFARGSAAGLDTSCVATVTAPPFVIGATAGAR